MKWTTTTASVAVAVLCMFVGAVLSRTMHDPTTIGTVSDRSRVQPLMSVEAEERSNPSSSSSSPSSVHGSQASQQGVRHSIPLREVQDIKFRPSDRVMRGSVATGTDTLIRACLAHEPATAGLFVSPSTVLVYRSMLPYGGIYKGYIGLLDLGYRAKLVFRKTAFEYSIPFVDEARGVSIVKMKFGGVFLRNQKNVESSATAIIHWHLGRISRIEIIEDDPKTLYEAFFTSAEAVVCKFYDTLFSGNVDDTASLLADDIKSTTHMFPSAIGERLAYTGVDGFRKSATSKSGDWLLNRLQSIRVLYGDNSTVVAEASLGMQSDAMKAALMSGGRFGQFLSFNSLPGGSLDNESLKDMKVISIFKVNDGHKISSVTQMLTAPLMPWNLRTLGLSGVPGLPEVAAEASKAAVKDRPEQQGKQEKPASQQQQGKQDKPVEQPGKHTTDKKSTDEKKP